MSTESERVGEEEGEYYAKIQEIVDRLDLAKSLPADMIDHDSILSLIGRLTMAVQIGVNTCKDLSLKNFQLTEQLAKAHILLDGRVDEVVKANNNLYKECTELSEFMHEALSEFDDLDLPSSDDPADYWKN